MPGWFRSKARCPVDLPTKQWIEWRLTWLVEELGLDRLKNGKCILPTEEFLPGQHRGSETEVKNLMLLVASYMDVDSTKLSLSFFEEQMPMLAESYQGAVGEYREDQGHFEIAMEVNSLADPHNVIATLAHEIGHVVLLGQKRIAIDEEDSETLTDLLTVFLGLGIFSANSVLHESNWTDGQMSGWSVGRTGYLSMDIYGYALALYALAREEPDPEWKVYLRPDVLAPFQRGIRYVSSTLDCDFVPAIEGL